MPRKAEEEIAELQFLLLGYVLMPNHVHLLISEPARGTPSVAIQVLKQRVSRAMRAGKRRNDESEPVQFWQRRFYDFNVHSRGKVKEKLNYMRGNPGMRKLANHPEDWPWSSWGFYERGEVGLIRIDVVEAVDSTVKDRTHRGGQAL